MGVHRLLPKVMQQGEQDNEAAGNWPDYQSGFSPPREFLPRLPFVNGIKHGRHLVGIIPKRLRNE
jgi:hypothetical protein